MLAFDRLGTGPPLLLLHGTNSSRRVWAPVLPALAGAREVIAVDLPAHGASPPTAFTPPDSAREVATFLDSLELERVAVVGHSSGGWTALELAKLGRVTGVLALAPAGLWLHRSPLLTDIELTVSWRISQVLGQRAVKPLRSPLGRRVALRQLSARPAEVAPEVAIDTARTAMNSKHFGEHFKRTRVLRYLGGQRIGPSVPVRVVWGDEDRIAWARTSRHTDQLPTHVEVETWEACGHMVMWDQPQRLIDRALALPA